MRMDFCVFCLFGIILLILGWLKELTIKINKPDKAFTNKVLGDSLKGFERFEESKVVWDKYLFGGVVNH